MKRVSQYLLLFSAIAVLAACSPHAGVFVSADNRGYFIELKRDGTFYARQGTATLTGKYEIHGDILTLRLPNGVFSNAIIRGDTITDSDGIQFVKGARTPEPQDARSGAPPR